MIAVYSLVNGLIAIGDSKSDIDCTPAIKPCAFPCKKTSDHPAKPNQLQTYSKQNDATFTFFFLALSHKLCLLLSTQLAIFNLN